MFSYRRIRMANENIRDPEEPIYECVDTPIGQLRFLDRPPEMSYPEALEGIKSEYPTGKELDTFLNCKRDMNNRHDDIVEIMSASEAADLTAKAMEKELFEMKNHIAKRIVEAASEGHYKYLYYSTSSRKDLLCDEVIEWLIENGFYATCSYVAGILDKHKCITVSWDPRKINKETEKVTNNDEDLVDKTIEAVSGGNNNE